jgi:hypothetical protein
LDSLSFLDIWTLVNNSFEAISFQFSDRFTSLVRIIRFQRRSCWSYHSRLRRLSLEPLFLRGGGRIIAENPILDAALDGFNSAATATLPEDP